MVDIAFHGVPRNIVDEDRLSIVYVMYMSTSKPAECLQL
jgi:hypothetical protein